MDPRAVELVLGFPELPQEDFLPLRKSLRGTWGWGFTQYPGGDLIMTEGSAPAGELGEKLTKSLTSQRGTA